MMTEAHVDAEIRKLRAALELVWRHAVRKDGHLGYERHSGLEKGCIPCICALALGCAVDDVTVEELEAEIEKLKLPPLTEEQKEEQDKFDRAIGVIS